MGSQAGGLLQALRDQCPEVVGGWDNLSLAEVRRAETREDLERVIERSPLGGAAEAAAVQKIRELPAR